MNLGETSVKRVETVPRPPLIQLLDVKAKRVRGERKSISRR